MKWKPNVPCVVVEQAAVGRQRAPPPSGSGAQQVLRALPSIPWNWREHSGSRAAAEQYLRIWLGRRLHGDTNTAVAMPDEQKPAVHILC